MSINPLFQPVKKDVDTIRNTVLSNLVKMLVNRKWILPENLQTVTQNLLKTHSDEDLFKIKLAKSLSEISTYEPTEDGKEKEDGETFDGTLIIVKILPQKLTGVYKSPIISEFLNVYKKNHKILIIESISEKAKQNLSSFEHTEIIEESFLMLDLLEHVCSPQYEVLSPTEEKEFLERYHLTRRQMPKMFDTDKTAIYLYLKKKQIVRIIRNSELTGKSIYYRIVVHRGFDI